MIKRFSGIPSDIQSDCYKSVSQSVDVANPVICTKYHNTSPPHSPPPLQTTPRRKIAKLIPKLLIFCFSAFWLSCITCQFRFSSSTDFFPKMKIVTLSPCHVNQTIKLQVQSAYFYIWGLFQNHFYIFSSCG